MYAARLGQMGALPAVAGEEKNLPLSCQLLEDLQRQLHPEDLAQCTLYIIPADMSDEDAVAHIHKTVDDLAMTGRFACRLRDEKPDRAVNLADELYRYSRLKYMELAEK